MSNIAFIYHRDNYLGKQDFLIFFLEFASIWYKIW